MRVDDVRDEMINHWLGNFGNMVCKRDTIHGETPRDWS